MLPFFPDAYPDELLYSVFARYHKRSGNISVKDTFLDLFNKRNLIPHAHIPRDLGILTGKIIGFKKVNLDTWIKKHTLFLYYSNFAKEQNKEKLLSIIVDGGDTNLPIRIIPEEYFKYCTECVREDNLKYGEIYWHKKHQIPGVFYCSIHSLELLESSVKTQSRHKGFYGYEPATLDNCPIDEISMSKIPNNLENMLMKISKECEKVAENDLSLSFEYIPKIYRYLLYREDYIKGSRNNFNKLKNDFINYYGHELLNFLRVEFNYSKRDQWLEKITKSSQMAFHPIKHVLLTLFLNDSVETLHNFGKDIEPFGKGPYPCLNPFSNHYKECVINSVKLEKCNRTNSGIGLFSCNCGFEFTRFNNRKKLMVKQIKNMNKQWEDEFIKLLEQEKIISIGFETKKDVVENYLSIFSSYLNGKQRRQKPTTKIINHYRNNWINLLRENPNASTEKLKKKDITTFVFLYKHDKNWLSNNMSFTNNCRDQEIDWEKRDKELLLAVEEARKELLSEDTPTRITRSSLGRSTNKLDIIRKAEYRDKMPKTYNYLDEILESVEEFQLRRVEYALKSLIQSGKRISETSIGRAANVIKGRSSVIDTKIKKYVEEYS